MAVRYSLLILYTLAYTGTNVSDDDDDDYDDYADSISECEMNEADSISATSRDNANDRDISPVPPSFSDISGA